MVLGALCQKRTKHQIHISYHKLHQRRYSLQHTDTLFCLLEGTPDLASSFPWLPNWADQSLWISLKVPSTSLHTDPASLWLQPAGPCFLLRTPPTWPPPLLVLWFSRTMGINHPSQRTSAMKPLPTKRLTSAQSPHLESVGSFYKTYWSTKVILKRDYEIRDHKLNRMLSGHQKLQL